MGKLKTEGGCRNFGEMMDEKRGGLVGRKEMNGKV
jgi:hypothetical protein